MRTEGEKNTKLERIPYREGRIELHRAGRGLLKALVYLPGARMCEPHFPSGSDRETVIAEANRIMDARLES